MTYTLSVQSIVNPADIVTVSAATPSQAISQACETLGLLDPNALSVRPRANGTLDVYSSVPSIVAHIVTVN